jgi:hypothetical protein
MEGRYVKDRLRLLLKHFGDVLDLRDPAKVRYPLPEVLFLVTCASITVTIMTRSRTGAPIIWAFSGDIASTILAPSRKTVCALS